VVLVTLGAQIARSRRDPRRSAVTTAVLLRLVGGPLIGLGLVMLLRLHGLPAQVLLVASAAPTAVNTAILSIEYGNEPDFAVNTVFITTLLSGLTVAATIYLARLYL